MKNILYGLLATLLFSNFATAQLMSDSIHNIMMNNYASSLNKILNPLSVQEGVTIDQLKKKIVNGNFTLPADAQASIIRSADSLKTYGGQFATAKYLTATSDELKYFYSTFAPSTVVQYGKLTESTTTISLTATDMWTCALSSFATDNCGSSILVGDASDLNGLAAASVNRLVVPPAGKYGMLVMLNGFNDCISRFHPDQFAFIGQEHNRVVDEYYNQVVSNNIQKDNLIPFIKTFAMNYAESRYNYSQEEIDSLQSTINYCVDVIPSLDMSTDFYSNLPNNDVISSRCRMYLDNLHAVLYDDQIDIYDVISKVQTIEQNANLDTRLNNLDLFILYSATSVAKASTSYWVSNIGKWDAYFSHLAGHPTIMSSKPPKGFWGWVKFIISEDILGGVKESTSEAAGGNEHPSNGNETTGGTYKPINALVKSQDLSGIGTAAASSSVSSAVNELLG